MSKHTTYLGQQADTNRQAPASQPQSTANPDTSKNSAQLQTHAATMAASPAQMALQRYQRQATAAIHSNKAPVQCALLSAGAASTANDILTEAQASDAEKFKVWNMSEELTAWEDITSTISITRNAAATLDVTLDGNAIAGSPFATLRLAVSALKPLIFTSLADDAAASRYDLIATTSTNIRKPSGETPFAAYADGKTVATAVEEAIAGLDFTGSISFPHSRHDFQPTQDKVHNLQVQLGGSKGNYRSGKGDTSSTVVVVDKSLWDAQNTANSARWKKVIQEAHRQSFANQQKIELKVHV